MPVIQAFNGIWPNIAESAFIADTAVIVGDVEIGEQASVWFGAVLRGDVGRIVVGARTNLQDGSIVHMTGGVSNVIIGADVTIGHAAVIHGADVGDGALVGMGAILLDNAVIGAQALVAAGSLVVSRTVVPPRKLAQGRPARVVRDLTDAECGEGRRGAQTYVELCARYRAG
jgi:carbonic anhydrase/acetyltransferase-like protein (isoleucine patch superfamily)